MKKNILENDLVFGYDACINSFIPYHTVNERKQKFSYTSLIVCCDVRVYRKMEI